MSDHPAFSRKTSRREILDVIQSVTEEHQDKKRFLMTLNSLVSHFQIKKGKDISPTTFRRYGVNPDGYFVKKWPDVFGYKTDGRSDRGLVIEVDKFEEKIGFGNIEDVELEER